MSDFLYKHVKEKSSIGKQIAIFGGIIVVLLQFADLVADAKSIIGEPIQASNEGKSA